jgi:hypothetical protein
MGQTRSSPPTRARARRAAGSTEAISGGCHIKIVNVKRHACRSQHCGNPIGHAARDSHRQKLSGASDSGRFSRVVADILCPRFHPEPAGAGALIAVSAAAGTSGPLMTLMARASNTKGRPRGRPFCLQSKLVNHRVLNHQPTASDGPGGRYRAATDEI